MAPRDGDEHGMERRPRQPQPVAPADGSDGEDDDIVDDDIVDDDVNEDDLNEDSEDEMDSDEAEEEEDPVARELRMQTLRTENEELMAERIEASVTLEQERQLTERIREDVRRIEAQRIELIAQRERDLEELARIEAAAAQGVDPPPLPPNPEEQSIQEEAIGGAGANPEANPDPS